MANSETVGAIMAFTPALIRALAVTSGGSAASLTCTDALILGAATTSGVRLDLESGVLAVREGDDSSAASLRAYVIWAGNAADNSACLNGATGVLGMRSTGAVKFTSTTDGDPSTGHDTGLARSAAGVVKVTDGSTGGGTLLSNALVLEAATTSGVRLDLESGTLAVREGDDSGYAPMKCGGFEATGNIISGDYVQCVRVVKAGIWEFNGSGASYSGTAAFNLKEASYFSATNVHMATASSGALSGASYSFSNALPAGAIILGVTVRVTTTITGATSFSIGDGSAVDRYGATIALASGTTTTFASATANPLEWRSANGNVVLTANGSNFTGGVVRVCVHYLTGTAPTS